MIKIDFSSAIAIYLSFSIFLVFVLWIFYNYKKNDIINETQYLRQCPYCTYMFFNYTSETPPKAQKIKEKEGDFRSKETNIENSKPSALVCPRCNSYIDL